MSTARLSIIFLGLLSLPVLVAGTCREQREVVGIEHTVNLTLRNQDVLPTHLFAGAEDFPCCQVAVGGNRDVELPSRGSLLLKAGRNQTILPGGSLTTEITQAEFDAGQATRIWLGNGWGR